MLKNQLFLHKTKKIYTYIYTFFTNLEKMNISKIAFCQLLCFTREFFLISTVSLCRAILGSLAPRHHVSHINVIYPIWLSALCKCLACRVIIVLIAMHHIWYKMFYKCLWIFRSFSLDLFPSIDLKPKQAILSACACTHIVLHSFEAIWINK